MYASTYYLSIDDCTCICNLICGEVDEFRIELDSSIELSRCFFGRVMPAVWDTLDDVHFEGIRGCPRIERSELDFDVSAINGENLLAVCTTEDDINCRDVCVSDTRACDRDLVVQLACELHREGVYRWDAVGVQEGEHLVNAVSECCLLEGRCEHDHLCRSCGS